MAAMATATTLPLEVLVTVFTFLDLPSIGRCAEVCKNYAKAAAEPPLWREIARRTFGPNLAEWTRQLYPTWKEMVQDENQRGLFPTLHLNIPSLYKYNSDDNFYCCCVEKMQWDRKNHRIRLYLDVRGERDLPHPQPSSISIPTKSENETIQFRGRWVSSLQAETPGHFQGYLVFPESRFRRDGVYKDGVYKFCYASLYHSIGDYHSVPIFEVTTTSVSDDGRRRNGLRKCFSSYELVDPPNFTESEECQKKRWMNFLQNNDMFTRRLEKRRRGNDDASWWV